MTWRTGFDDTAMDPTELARLRWRCRRGLLENDLILERFMEARGPRILHTVHGHGYTVRA